MTSFKFDATQSFDANLELFLVEMEPDDKEMAAILRENSESLKAVVVHGERNNQARSDFNAKVNEALNLMLAPENENGNN